MCAKIYTTPIKFSFAVDDITTEEEKSEENIEEPLSLTENTQENETNSPTNNNIPSNNITARKKFKAPLKVTKDNLPLSSPSTSDLKQCYYYNVMFCFSNKKKKSYLEGTETTSISTLI